MSVHFFFSADLVPVGRPPELNRLNPLPGSGTVVTLGSKFTVLCIGGPGIQWVKDGTDFMASRRIMTTVNSKNDAGFYQCLLLADGFQPEFTVTETAAIVYAAIQGILYVYLIIVVNESTE